jgi:hypothetical protein
VERRKLRPVGCFYTPEERERGVWSRTSATSADDWPVRWERGVVMTPLSRVRLTCGCGRFEADPGHCSIESGPIHNPTIFLFSKLIQICKFYKPPYIAPKFIKLCNLVEWKIRNNFSFGRKFKCKTEIELKFLEANCF